eukprot:scaffold116855_cov42-Phaeocystis_antarctica.AAC.1
MDAHRSARASSHSPTRPPTTCRPSPHMACAWPRDGAPAAALEAPAGSDEFAMTRRRAEVRALGGA